MELVIITTLIAVVTLILQLVILSNQKKNAKLINDFIRTSSRQRPQHSDRDKNNDRRDGNYSRNRRGGNSPNNTRHQKAPSSGAVDSVEKSLRDINLKLKHAERDQEAARKKLGNDSSGKDGQSRSRSNRGGKDSNRRDRGGRNNNRSRNDGERNSERSNNRSKTPHPAAGSDDNKPAKPAESAPPAAAAASAPELPALKPKDFDSDTEHGRKFSVKRRVIKEENTAVGQTGDAPENTAPVKDVPVDASAVTDAEISFGRR